MSPLDRPRATSRSTSTSRAVNGDMWSTDRRGAYASTSRRVTDGAHGRDQPLRRGLLEQEPAGPGAQRGVDVLVEVERGEDQHPRRRPGSGQDVFGGGDAVEAGHADVHQD